MHEERGPAKAGWKPTRRELIVAATLAPALAGLSSAATATTEGRGVWLHPESFDANETKGKGQIRANMEQLAKAGFNLVLPWTLSSYLVALDNEKYRNWHPVAKWDALGVITEEAHRVGMQTHLWYSFTSYRTLTSADYDPSVGGNPAWAARHITELPTAKPTAAAAAHRPSAKVNLCPQHVDARNWQNQLIGRALKRYPLISGIHVEECGYDYIGYCVCDLCLELYPKLYGPQLAANLDTKSADDFRTLGTNAVMEEMAATVAGVTPKLMLSTDGGFFWRDDRLLGRDWFRWAKAGLLDFYAPEIYTDTTATFRTRLASTVKDLGVECPVFAGIAVKWGQGGRYTNTVAQVENQIAAARELGAKGVILFYGAAITPELYSALASGPFHSPAVMPSPK